MNKLFHPINSLKKLRLFAVMIIAMAMAVSACKKPTNGIGDSIQPEDDLMNAFQTDTTSLYARTILVDSVRSDFYSNIMVGNYIDENFGVVKTTGVLQFVPSTSRPRYGQNIRVDSVVLSLVYQNHAYGKNAAMYFNVKEVLDNLNYDSSYYTSTVLKLASQNLVKPGMETMDPSPESAAISSSGSTPALRLHLKNSLGYHLLETDTNTLDSQALFKEYFGGLAISSETMDGQVINYVRTDSETKLVVYYANLDGPEEVLGNANFIAATSTCKGFTQIQNQYQGTALQNLQNTNSVDGSEYCYLQSGGGTRVGVNIGNVKWLKNYKGVTINRAELVIPYDNGSKFAPINTVLIFYKQDGSEFYTSTNTGGNVNVSTGLYRINITNHIQNYLAGDINTDEIIIQPDYVLSEFANSWSVRRSLLHGPDYSLNDPLQNMRLIITYSY